MTHPFHPWFGREFPFVARQQTWRQDRVFFFDDGSMQSLPTAWTDVAEPDVFVTVAAGRSPFRVEDLLALAEIIDGIRAPRCKEDSADTVREIPPQSSVLLKGDGARSWKDCGEMRMSGESGLTPESEPT